MAEIATLGVRVDNQQAITGLAGVETAIGAVKSAAATLGITLGAGALFKSFIDASVESQRTMSQLEAAVKSTGMAAGYTAGQLREQAMAMQQLSGFSHDAIEKTQGILLMFQQLRGVQFQEATQAAADLAVRMGTDIPEAARQLGKALEDPTTGLMMLRRAGVVFTKDQQEVIKSLVETGQLAKAQAMILDLVAEKVGGSAAAFRDTLGGALANLKNVWHDTLEASQKDSQGMIDAINGIASALPALRSAVDAAFTELDQEMANTAIEWNRLVVTMKGWLADYLDISAKVSAATGFSTDAAEKRAWAASLRTNLDALGAGLNALQNAHEGETAKEKLWNEELKLSNEILGIANSLHVAAHDAANKMLDDLNKSIAKKKEELVFQKQHVDLLVAEAVAQGKLDDLKNTVKTKADTALLAQGITTPELKSALTTFNDEQEKAAAKLNDDILNGAIKTATEEAARRKEIREKGEVEWNALVNEGQAQQAEAAKKANEELAKQAEEASKRMLIEVQKDFASFFDTILSGGTNTFGKLWDTVKSGFSKLISDLLSSDLMKSLKDKFPQTFGYSGPNAGTSGLPVGVGALSSGPSVGALAGIGAFVAGLSLIGTSILATSQLNAQAARQFASDNVTWAAAFKNLNESFTDTSAQKQVQALAAQFQTLMDTAIQEAATAIQNSPAATYGASGVGLFGSKTGTVPGAGTIADLDAYIAQLTKAQGTGKNVAQDRDLATLLAQLTELDAKYKEQADALAKVIAAQQLAYQADLKVRQLTAAGETDAAAQAQRRIDEDKQIADAQAAGYDDATIALLKQVQAAEDAKTAADALLATMNAARKAATDYLTLQARYAAATNDPNAERLARQAQEQAEIDALVAAKADAATIALTKLAQAAEDTAAAAKAAYAAQNALNDLSVRDLRATGQGGAADLLALQNQQGMEWQAAIDAHSSDAYLALLKKTLADEMAQFLLGQQTAANSTATVAAAGAAGSVLAASTTTSVTSAVSATVTEYTAYQLVDIGRSQLVVLRDMARDIKWLAGHGLMPTINQGLGTIADNSNLSGGNVTRS